MKFYLGLEVHMNIQGLFLSQYKFIVNLLKSANMKNCKLLFLPLDPHSKLCDDDLLGPVLLNPYRALIGKLLHLYSSQPDISFFVQLLSQYLHALR